MLKIKIPNIKRDEHIWVINQVFNRFLNIKYTIEIHDLKFIEICINEIKIVTPSIFLTQNSNDWLTENSLLPQISYLIINKYFVNSKLTDLPILFGSNSIDFLPKSCEINFDIFGSIFYVLSNYNDVISNSQDIHFRSIGKNSFLYKNNLLFRPIVDEYCYFLSLLLNQYVKSYNPVYNLGKIEVSCDLDQPVDRANNFLLLAKSLSADILIRRNFILFTKRISNFYLRKFGNYFFDPNNTFNKYISITFKYGHVPIFYFLPFSTNPEYDGKYSLNNKHILKIIELFISKKCKIGLHGSYDSFNRLDLMRRGISNLNNTLLKYNLIAEHNRQHYLRWDPILTPLYLEESGLKFDSSGAYADVPGFKYGTSKEFNMWCFSTNRELNLVQKPLIFMECSVISKKYLGLGYSQSAYNLVHELKEKCIFHNGTFVMLWHNSFLISKKDWNFFEFSIKK